MDRATERLIAQCRTRWGPLCNDYRHQDLRYTSAACTDCGQPDGVEHVVFHCAHPDVQEMRCSTIGMTPGMEVFSKDVQGLVFFIQQVHRIRQAQWEDAKERMRQTPEGESASRSKKEMSAAERTSGKGTRQKLRGGDDEPSMQAMRAARWCWR